MYNSLKQALLKITPDIHPDKNLRNYTTFNLGGPADFIAVAKSSFQVIEIIKLCKKESIPFKLLGAGSNVIISDRGFRGVIIVNKSGHWAVSSEKEKVNQYSAKNQKSITARLSSVGNEFYTTDGLEYKDPEDKKVLVKAEGGLRIIPFIKALFQKKITGLQWFSGIPASVGGATYMNMHGGEYFFGDFVVSAKLFDGENSRSVNHDYFRFGYDWSILHETAEIILEVDLLLYYGDVEKARALSVDWARRKSLQPQKSAGCIFQNLTPEQKQRLNLPTSSIGYLVDKVLGLKGIQRGDAVISDSHAAFIENLGLAKADDVFYLYRLIKDTARQKLSLDLKEEVEFIGLF